MKKLAIVALILISNAVKAQEGIHFERDLSWAQVKEKAKSENKYIFVDAYTTWCLPCRVMANEIFPQKKVGDFFNSNFINVAVQFDVTKNDSPEIKSWYEDAKSLAASYQVNSFPTYLFFNPQGELVHKVGGASPDADQFIAKAQKALNKETQYYTLKQRYEAGAKDPDFLLSLIRASDLSTELPFIYPVINEYLITQKDLLTEENLRFVLVATYKSTDPGFSVLLNHAIQADAVIGKAKSAEIASSIIFEETVVPYLRIGGEKVDLGNGLVYYTGEVNEFVNWKEIKIKLDSQYPALADEVMWVSKATYYGWQNNWPEFSESVSAYVAKYPNSISNDRLNSYAMQILFNSEDPRYLKTALGWSKKAVSADGNSKISYVYIYAALLYKTGKKEQAIKILGEAVEQSKDTGLTEVLNKMKKGEKI